jgi:peptidoglycan glycosyltransferase
MNRQLKRISTAVVIMFMSLFIGSTFNQVVRADLLYDDSRNLRATYESYKTKRGSILVSGQAIVESVAINTDYRYLRQYSSPIYSSVTGFFSVFGTATGIERANNDFLTGQSSSQFFEQINALLDGKPVTGAAVELTLDAELQQLAWDALGEKTGAVVALDPKTGRILAMVSKPSFDANQLAEQDFDAYRDSFDELDQDETQPLVNRAIAGDMNPPGSVFKLVVAAAALESGEFAAETQVPNPTVFTLPGTTTQIRNSGGSNCGGGESVSMELALARSCNIPFAQIGITLGDERIRAQAELFGFNSQVSIPLQAAASTYPADLDSPQTALSAFGQFDVRATPLQMAMVTAAIANQGVLLQPQLISRIVASNLNVLSEPGPRVFSSPISRETAAILTRMMVTSVSAGAASNAGIEGVAVAGKTGTAENGEEQPYTLWFTGFAPATDPEIVVAVVIENGGGLGQNGTGNQLAAPIGRELIRNWLAR